MTASTPNKFVYRADTASQDIGTATLIDVTELARNARIPFALKLRCDVHITRAAWNRYLGPASMLRSFGFTTDAEILRKLLWDLNAVLKRGALRPVCTVRYSHSTDSLEPVVGLFEFDVHVTDAVVTLRQSGEA
jgi:hypothetical protein